MLPAIGLLLGGAAILYLGAEAAVRGAAGITRTLGVSAFALGALLFGIDLESLVAGVVASARGQPAIAAGEIFGTVVFLYGPALGIALLVARRPVPSPSPIMVLAPAVPLVAAAGTLADRYVGRLEGALLMGLYGTYVFLVILRARGEPEARAEELEREAATAPRSPLALVLMTLAGLVLLYAGASVAVGGAEDLARATALGPGFVGAAVLGALASLDELLLEVLPIRRGNPELATGNLMGTLAAFTSGVLGLAAVVRPINVDSGAALAFLGAATLYAIVGTVFLARGEAGRMTGAVLLATYVSWLLGSGAA